MLSAPHGVRIVSARPEDAEAIRSLRRAVLAEGRWFATTPREYTASVQQVRGVVASLLRQPNGFLLVARADVAEVVGVVAVHGEGLTRMVHLGRLEMMVARDWRGRGIGKALLHHAIERAERNAVLRKLSLAVFEDNLAALSLYERAGFVHEGRRPGEYRLEDGTERADLLLARRVAT